MNNPIKQNLPKAGNLGDLITFVHQHDGFKVSDFTATTITIQSWYHKDNCWALGDDVVNATSGDVREFLGY